MASRFKAGIVIQCHRKYHSRVWRENCYRLRTSPLFIVAQSYVMFCIPDSFSMCVVTASRKLVC